jgi:hypothetical protein
MCWTLHAVVLAEHADVSANKSINMETDLIVSDSKASNEEDNVNVFSAASRDKQDTEMKKNPQETSLDSALSNTASNYTENSAESDTKEGVEFKTEDEQNDPLETLYTECNGRLYCVQQRFVALIDRLDAMKSIPMFGGYVTIEKTSEEVPATDVIADSEAALLSRVDRYLKSHSIRVHIPEMEPEVQELSGRLFQKRFLDFNLGALATNDASEGQ